MFALIFYFSAGSKLEAAIAEGPEALQKFIDSGEIEELHDVMPINDDDQDYLNDYDSNEDSQGQNHMSSGTSHTQDLDLMHSGDSDLRNMDQDMRSFNSYGRDSDLRSLDPDYRNAINRELNFQPPPRDYDMRNDMGDEDFRQPFGRGEDFRHYEEEENYDEYYDESRGNWQRNGNYGGQFARNQTFGGNYRNQASNFNRDQFGGQSEGWNGHDNFRVRGAKRGGVRGQRGVRNNRGSTRARGNPRGSGRGGGAPNRGQSSSRGRF